MTFLPYETVGCVQLPRGDNVLLLADVDHALWLTRIAFEGDLLDLVPYRRATKLGKLGNDRFEVSGGSWCRGRCRDEWDIWLEYCYVSSQHSCHQTDGGESAGVFPI